MKTDSRRAAYLRGDLTHDSYYALLVDLLGERALYRVLPGNREPADWSALLEVDAHLNNVPLERWDALHGYVFSLVNSAGRAALLPIIGSGGWSLSDSVCVLKCAARRYAKTRPAFRSDLRTLETTAPGYRRVVATFGVRWIEGNSSPYFVATGEAWETGSRRRDSYTSGMIHDVLLSSRAGGELTSFVSLHLSDLDGVPMHAAANGWYHYRAGNLEAVGRLLRVDPATLPVDADEEEFGAFVDAQRARWSLEARDLIAHWNLEASS